MRPLEDLLIVVGVLAMASGMAPRFPRRLAQIIAVLVVLLAVAQIATEGYRWQMISAYAAAALLVIFTLWPNPKLRRLASCAGFILFLGALSLGVVYPVFRLPQPTGSFAIGTVTFDFVDDHRPEVFSKVSGTHREIMVQAWYPATVVANSKIEPYREAAATTFRNAYLTQIPTHAQIGAPLLASNSKYPVVIFTPSWHGVRNQNMSQVEALVSHGFIVLGVDHPYGSAVTVFPDGRTIWALPDKFLDTSSEQSLKESFQIAEKQVNVRSDDLIFLLNTLSNSETTHALGILNDALDLSRVGVLGYSFGGAVAAEACWKDPRFKAAINMDGDLFGESATQGISQPYFAMSDSFSEPSADDLNSPNLPWQRWERVIDEQSRLTQHTMETHGGYTLELPRFAHGNFSDSTLSSPIRRFTDSGRIDPRLGLQIVNEYTLAFFNKVLKGLPENLMDASSGPYSEAQLRVYPAPLEAKSTP